MSVSRFQGIESLNWRMGRRWTLPDERGESRCVVVWFSPFRYRTAHVCDQRCTSHGMACPGRTDVRAEWIVTLGERGQFFLCLSDRYVLTEKKTRKRFPSLQAAQAHAARLAADVAAGGSLSFLEEKKEQGNLFR